MKFYCSFAFTDRRYKKASRALYYFTTTIVPVIFG
jgi:hypothetical protein